MLDHIGLTVSNLAASTAFYEAALAPLGVSIQMAPTPEMIAAGFEGYGFGEAGKPCFWISAHGPAHRGSHIAFTAKTRAEVDSFYEAAMAAGGRDNGPPGLRLHYHPDYYAAFVFDPDGMNIEAVCHRPE